MDYINQINVNDTNYSVGLPNLYINAKGNLNLETSSDLGNTSKGKINIEAMNDIQFKPGDDIILYSHHRPEGNQDEVTVKVTDGDDVPVKLQLNAAEMLLTTKDKVGDNSNVFDVTVNSAKNTRGYLKVRAQAIDLRSETHGGIALQPKGRDSLGNMNKIKFEHGGGDGLEFGTFNTEKASIFTDEYRFNKEGLWYMTSRVKEASDKADASDNTTAYKYKKQADDFYDVIDPEDEVADTNAIIKTANAFNYGKNRHAKITSKGNLEIATVQTFTVTKYTGDTTDIETLSNVNSIDFENGKTYTLSELDDMLDADLQFNLDWGEENGNFPPPYSGSLTLGLATDGGESGYTYFTFTANSVPNINIESFNGIKLSAKDKIELSGELDFGNSFDFGETENGINTQVKYTKKGKTKRCTMLKVTAVNNHETNPFIVDENLKSPSTGRVACQKLMEKVEYVGMDTRTVHVYLDTSAKNETFISKIKDCFGNDLAEPFRYFSIDPNDDDSVDKAWASFMLSALAYSTTDDLITGASGRFTNAYLSIRDNLSGFFYFVIHIGKGDEEVQTYSYAFSYPDNRVIYPTKSEVIAECDIFDIIKLTTYMKENQLGPWLTASE